MTDILHRITAALANRYTIQRELGEGGMATVYLAEDLKHHRQVALKVLRPELAAIIGADRFLKEIEVTANLQHPNILPLYDSGDADSFLYYVMPYVEGETLRDKMNRERQLTVEDTIEIAKAVAAALDFAHQRGVIHRDIKPENILLQAGQALVADFGIALAVSHAGGTRLTETGLSLGTPHYMSPEQATGDRAVDARSDVYALGATVYEMLVGEPPHVGNSVQAIIAKILSDTPAPITRSREMVPPNVEAAVQRALARSPADRFAHAADFAAALTNPGFTLPTMTTPAVPGRRPGPWNRMSVLLAAVSAVLAVGLAWSLTRPRPAMPPSRQRIVLGAADAAGMIGASSAIAPDGSAIVYPDTVGGATRLWIKERDQLRAVPLASTSQFPAGPFFSHDGEWVAFGNGRLMKVARRGGSVTVLSDSNSGFDGGAWLENGTIIFTGGNTDRLYLTHADGGATIRLTVLDQIDPQVVGQVHPLPGSRGVLFSVFDPDGTSNVYAYDLETNSIKVAIPDASSGWYLAPGRVLFARPDGAVFVAPFDLGVLEVDGPVSPVLGGVRTATGIPDLQVASDGTMFYATGTATGLLGRMEAVWIGRDGAVTPVDTSWTFSVAANGGVSLSPDGTRLALDIVDSATGRTDVYIKRLPNGSAQRSTFEGTQNIRPEWSRDGRMVLFSSNAGGQQDLWSKRADGSQNAQLLLHRDRMVWEGSWSPDGKWLVYRTDDVAAGRGDILAVQIGQDSTSRELVATEAEETSPVLSPDGRWLAYSSGVSGRKEVYVRPFPNAQDAVWQVSFDGGAEPAWAHSGRELFYRNAQQRLVAVEVSSDPTFEVGTHRQLFDTRPFPLNDDHHFYAVSPDDRRFLFLRSVGTPAGTAASELILVEHWIQELSNR